MRRGGEKLSWEGRGNLAREVVPKQVQGHIQVEHALCFCGGCQVLVACKEFGSPVVGAQVCWLYLLDGQIGFLVEKSYSVVVQHSIPVHTSCTGRYLVTWQIALLFKIS